MYTFCTLEIYEIYNVRFSDFRSSLEMTIQHEWRMEKHLSVSTRDYGRISYAVILIPKYTNSELIFMINAAVLSTFAKKGEWKKGSTSC